ncbi:(2Fe-2S) ferredoxin domain-containing protein [Paracoccus sp. (in: a-proteobacteria)]|uniref:(2Fe-2S) ferredoxin domain-containing protein n=1 Tax=Paracoccus sp. TaxID=267 RepID=UPI0026E1036C|nr:(2Fe-2S) ferredoxin domain-containing protein [Paracoccus sp. (in: a-proteobacteria)]MDO5647158.1 (2Fe-2S) ferredoxin domain-containing protein [Paracoccus sp. (in: a-proteobacteria)]
MSGAVILYGRASFIRQQRLQPLAQGVKGPIVELAYEDLSGPALPDVIDALATKGVTQITVVPCGVPADASISAWLPGALSAHVAGRVQVAITPGIEAFLDLPGAIQAALAAPAQDIATVPPSMGKPGWSNVPLHRRQVFFCMGARCAHRQGLPLYQHLRQLMKAERSLASGPGRVMCARSSCLFPCNQGPLMVVQPDGVWYGGLTRDLLARIVREHLIGGQPVRDAMIHHRPMGGASPLTEDGGCG